jgi:hypothetical protein
MYIKGINWCKLDQLYYEKTTKQGKLEKNVRQEPKLIKNNYLNLTHSQVPGWTHLRIHQSVVAESWDSKGAPGFQL